MVSGIGASVVGVLFWARRAKQKRFLSRWVIANRPPMLWGFLKLNL
jgi:hypothetical protein